MGSRRNIKLPSGKHEHMPIMTQQDSDDLMTIISKQSNHQRLMCYIEIDYISIPYTVRKRDITTVKDTLGYTGSHI